MTSTVTVTFASPRDFSVHIDNIESLNPQALDRAQNAIERTYRGMRAQYVAKAKADAAKKEAEARIAAELEAKAEEERKEAEIEASAARVAEKQAAAGVLPFSDDTSSEESEEDEESETEVSTR